MASFPLFIDLEDKKCVVVGGGKVASRKIETLCNFNGNIFVISPEITHKINILKDSGKLTHIKRCYESSDIEGAFMVIAATSDALLNEKIYNDAANHGILVNVADDPQKCTFFFPSVVKRSDLIIGISTSGSYPALSKQIRKKVDSIINNNINANVISILKEFREKVIHEIDDEQIKAKILDKVLEEIVFINDQVDIIGLKAKLEETYKKYTKSQF
jgi:precorrin-2 dehydrogenase/sirohydrochlorin ferrochelatase